MSDNSENEKDGWGRVLAESFIIFAIIVLIPYLIGGVWPPFVSVVSGSMEPNMVKGDMIYVVDNERYSHQNSVNGVDISTNSTEENFNRKGDVIIYYPNGNKQNTPIIHRAIYHTNESENWVDDVDNRYLNHNDCNKVRNCPAPNSGYITLGDNNNAYDQSAGLSKPVQEEWIRGKAHIRIPYVGHLRLIV